MILYSLLHLAQVKAVNPNYETLGKLSVTLDDIKNFRQLGNKFPGHPEYHRPIGYWLRRQRGYGDRRSMDGRIFQPIQLRDDWIRRLHPWGRWVHDGGYQRGISITGRTSKA